MLGLNLLTVGLAAPGLTIDAELPSYDFSKLFHPPRSQLYAYLCFSHPSWWLPSIVTWDTCIILRKRRELNICRWMWSFISTISKHSSESTRTSHSPDLSCEASKPALGFYILFHKERFMRIFFECSVVSIFFLINEVNFKAKNYLQKWLQHKYFAINFGRYFFIMVQFEGQDVCQMSEWLSLHVCPWILLSNTLSP